MNASLWDLPLGSVADDVAGRTPAPAGVASASIAATLAVSLLIKMLEISGKGGRATRMFKNVSKAFPTASPDIPKLLDVLRQNGVTVAA